MMSRRYYPVPEIHPRRFNRHVFELWNYEWNGAREDYDRVSFQTIHIIQLRDNPAPKVSGLDLAPNGIIPLEDLDRTTMEMLAPEHFRNQGPPPPVHRPPCSVGAMLFWISLRLINLRILQLRVNISLYRTPLSARTPRLPALLWIHPVRRTVRLPLRCHRRRSSARPPGMC